MPTNKSTTGRATSNATAKKATAKKATAKKVTAKKPVVGPAPVDDASREIDAKLASLGDWRGKMLSRLRALILEAVPGVVEEVKWRKPSNPGGVPVWSHGGIICTGELYKDKVKLTFANGAALKDPTGLFNTGFGGNTRRAIDVHEGADVDDEAFKALIRAAAAANGR